MRIVGLGSAGIALSGYTAWRGNQAPTPNLWLMLALWVVSILLIFLACVSLTELRTWVQPRQNRREWLYLLALFVLGLALRAAWLNVFPVIMAEDEGYFAAQAADLGAVYHWQANPFRYDVHYHPLLFHTLQAVSIDFFGRTLAAARLPSALLGALGIVGVYLLGKQFDRRVGWLAALFTLTFPLQVHFSRLALNQMLDPVCAVWMLAFLVRAMRGGRRLDYALAGLFLGLSQYGYSATRLIPFLVLAYVLQKLWLRQGEIKGVLVTALVAGVVFLPQGYFLLFGRVEGVSPRLNTVGIWVERDPFTGVNHREQVEWGKQLTRPFLGYVIEKDAGIFYGKFDPFLGWFAGVPCLIGLLVALRRWRGAEYLMLIWWWLMTTILGGVLLTNPPEFQRFVITTPALAILVGLGILTISDGLVWLSYKVTPDQPIPLLAEKWLLPLLLVIGLATVNFKTYFLDYRLDRPYFRVERFYDLNVLATDILPELSAYDHVWYLPARNLNLTTSPILLYLVPEVHGIEYLGSPEALPVFLQNSPGSDAVIIVPSYPQFDPVFRQLSALTDAELWTPYNLQTGKPLVVIFLLEK